jgi:putative membrane protein insertion efficiency factor
MTWPARIGIMLVHVYQLVLSPFTGGACRFEPSCSVYATRAFEVHGFRRGMWLALTRVARCHPFARPGLDPVPPRTNSH